MPLRLALWIVLIIMGRATAQPERYELGQRLKAFEKAWDKYPDPAGRKRALEILPNVTTQFFSLNLGGAGRTLDEARWRLESKDEPSDAVKWLTSLTANPERRLLDADAKVLNVEIKHFYKMKGDVPKGARVRISFPGDDGVQVAIAKLPMTVPVPVPKLVLPKARMENDQWLTIDMTAEGTPILHSEMMISQIHQSASDLNDIRDFLKEVKTFDDIESATVRETMARIDAAMANDIPETDFPYASLAFNCFMYKSSRETIREEMKRGMVPPFQSLGSRDEWYSVPVTDRKAVPVRVLVPELYNHLKPKKRPVVFALHGAGGTENLFFEGYGNGHIVKECLKRKWYLVAPRSGINLSGAPPIKTILEQLAKRLPIDTEQVFILGHSMGAMQTITACQENPGLFQAAAALGGGGRVKDAKVFDALPVFVGVGDKDFALSGAKSLAKTLKDGGAKAVTYKEYPNLEHLVIVREALPDVFKMFDEVMDAKKNK